MKIQTTLTDSPKRKPQTAPPFGHVFTDHMFTLDYAGGEWKNPRIVPYGPISVEPSAMALHYGQALFEGLKAYRSGENVYLFRPEMNFKRLNVSHERLCIPPLDENLALEALTGLIKLEKNWVPDMDGASLYIRPFTFATEPQLGVKPSAEYKFMIILSPCGPYYAEGFGPVKIRVEEEYVRAVRGGLGFTKATANYAMSLKGQEKAKELGYTQVLWLDAVERRYIEEVGTMNVFFKIGGEVITPELGGSILPGITRDSAITLLRDMGETVTERRLSIDELIDAAKGGYLEEAFGTGTAAVISPVGHLAWQGAEYAVNGGKTGEIARALYERLTGIQYGRLEDKFGWVRKV
jgi:branched-chain amino acid aminotransferase